MRTDIFQQVENLVLGTLLTILLLAYIKSSGSSNGFPSELSFFSEFEGDISNTHNEGQREGLPEIEERMDLSEFEIGANIEIKKDIPSIHRVAPHLPAWTHAEVAEKVPDVSKQQNLQEPERNIRGIASSDGLRVKHTQQNLDLKDFKSCLQCNAMDHWLQDCRNPKGCFTCVRTGHISHTCSLTSSHYSPSPSFSPSDVSSLPSSFVSLVPKGSFLVMAPSKEHHFLQNNISDRIEKHLTQGIILVTDSPYNASDLLVALRFCFSSNGYKWAVKSLGDHRFLVDAPENWRTDALVKGCLVLGGISVKIDKVEGMIDKDSEPIRVWVKVSSLPVGLCSKEGLEYLVFDFARLIHWEIPPYYKTSDKAVRLLLDVSSLEVIPPFVWCEFITKSGLKKNFRVMFAIESASSGSQQWKKMETMVNKLAREPSAGLRDSSMGDSDQGTITPDTN